MSQHPAELSPEALQAESTALRRLAHSLLGDAHAAEDATQDAWVAALERAPDTGLGGWLSVVTRNFALKSRRSDTRRKNRERSVARPELETSTADALARVEIHQRVVAAVLSLAEPYRMTVVFRYWENLAPRLVAKRMGVPVDTVRTRLRRANEQLREKLDRSCGDRAAWAGPLAAWAAPRVSTGTLASSGIGLLVMSMKVKVAALCLVGLVAGWFLTERVVLGNDSSPLPLAKTIIGDGEEPQSPTEERDDEADIERNLADLPNVQPTDASRIRFMAIAHTGQPAAGVSLKLYCEGQSWGGTRGWPLGQTDTNGLLNWDCPEHVLESLGSATWTAFAELPGGTCAATTFVPVELDETALEIYLPPTGSLTVRVTDEAGQALDGRYLAGGSVARISPLPISQRGVKASDYIIGELQGLQEIVESLLDPEGFAHFPHVLLNTQLVVKFGTYDPEVHSGPEFESQHKLIEYRIPSSPALVGRLLDAKGRAFANSQFRFSLRSGRGSSFGLIATDASGHFRVKLDTSHGDYFLEQDPWIFIKEGDYNAMGEGISAGLPLPTTLIEGRNNLGDIQLTEPPLIVSGRIRTEGCDLPDFVPMKLAAKTMYWNDLGEIYGVQLEEGRFEFRGHVSDLPLRLEVQKGPWLEIEPIEIEAGREDLEIILAVGGSMQATFLLDEGPWSKLRYRLLREENDQQGRLGSLLQSSFISMLAMNQGQNRPSSVTWQGLHPGKYRFTAQVPGSGEAIIDLPDIVVPAGGEAEDPRLTAIDLRNLNLINLTLHLDGGEQVQSDAVGILVESETDDWFRYDMGEGLLQLPIAEPVNLWAYAPGHISLRLESVQRDTRIDLRPAPELTFQVVPMPDLATDMHLQLTLFMSGDHVRRPLESTAGRGGFAEGFLGAMGESMRVSAEGLARMRLRYPRQLIPSLSLVRGERRAKISTEYALIDLGALPIDQPVVIPLDQEALEAALEKLRN